MVNPQISKHAARWRAINMKLKKFLSLKHPSKNKKKKHSEELRFFSEEDDGIFND
jgi:hypothetical protein